jgi:hypothetical protein
MELKQIDTSKGAPVYAFGHTNFGIGTGRPIIAIGQKSSGTIWIWDGSEHSILVIEDATWESTPNGMAAEIRDTGTGDLLAYVAPLADWPDDQQNDIFNATVAGREILATEEGKAWLEATLQLYK